MHVRIPTALSGYILLTLQFPWRGNPLSLLSILYFTSKKKKNTLYLKSNRSNDCGLLLSLMNLWSKRIIISKKEIEKVVLRTKWKKKCLHQNIIFSLLIIICSHISINKKVVLNMIYRIVMIKIKKIIICNNSLMTHKSQHF